MRSLIQIVLFVGLLLCGHVLSKAAEVVFLGDSNTWIGGDDCDMPGGWSCHFAARDTSLVCRSYARSGATWTANRGSRPDAEQYAEVLTDNNIIYNQIKRLDEAMASGCQAMPDLIVVAAGTNDAWFEHRRPDIYASGVAEAVSAMPDTLRFDEPGRYSSLAMSVRLGCEYLRTICPQARLVVLTPLQAAKIDAAKLDRVSDIIEATAERIGVEVIRQDLVCPIRGANEDAARRLTSDGIHTSEEGAREVGNILFDIIFKEGRHGIL